MNLEEFIKDKIRVAEEQYPQLYRDYNETGCEGYMREIKYLDGEIDAYRLILSEIRATSGKPIKYFKCLYHPEGQCKYLSMTPEGQYLCGFDSKIVRSTCDNKVYKCDNYEKSNVSNECIPEVYKCLFIMCHNVVRTADGKYICGLNNMTIANSIEEVKQKFAEIRSVSSFKIDGCEQ